MKIPVDPCAVDSITLRCEINRLRRELEAFESELEARGGEDRVVWGFIGMHGYVVRKTFDEAAAAAVDYYKDPDAGYRVHTVYLHKGENI